MGGLCDTSPDPVPTSTTVVSGTSIPEWVSAGGQRLFGEAESLAQRPYTPYAGPRIAGLSEGEERAGALSMAGADPGDIPGARALIKGGSTRWTDPGVAESYINPFTKGVTDIAARETERRNLAERPGRGGRAVAAGAFGGARHGVQEAENRRNLDQIISDIYMRGGAEAWNTGRTAFGADAARMLQGGGALSALGQTGLSNLLTTGGQERGIEQAGLETAYGDFREQRQWPYSQLNFALGALSGTPYEVDKTTTSTGTALVPQQSPVQTAAGLGLTGAGIYNLMQ